MCAFGKSREILDQRTEVGVIVSWLSSKTVFCGNDESTDDIDTCPYCQNFNGDKYNFAMRSSLA